MGGSCPPGSVEPDTRSLWMELFSLGTVVFIILTCNIIVCHFHMRGRFSGDISHDKY